MWNCNSSEYEFEVVLDAHLVFTSLVEVVSFDVTISDDQEFSLEYELKPCCAVDVLGNCPVTPG